MNRRDFIVNASLSAGIFTSIPDRMSAFTAPKYKMGYQLFSVRGAMAQNPIQTLAELKAMGYEDFEIYGFDEAKSAYYGFAATEFKKQLDDLGISVSSGHYGFAPFLQKSNEDLLRYVDQCIAAAKILRSKYITWPYLDPAQRSIENFKLLTTKLNLIGEQVTKAGLGFAYHNHGFEFEDYNGQTGFEIITKETDSTLVKLQMDMYWVMHSSKFTPKQLIEKHPGRFVMWHIKDMDKISRDYTELGNGSINYLEQLPNPVKSGLEYYFLEQGGNFAKNPMQSAADSARYFKQHLQKYL